MRVPLRWLSEYVDLTLDPAELARRLTIAGAEVDQVIRTGGDWDGVRVGQVEMVEPHPNADRLVLATVNVGDGESHQVVCGAPNVAAGQKIAYAGIGARLIDGHSGKPATLKAAVIRGVESAGMICSERELGLSDEHEGILVLPQDAPLGQPLSDVLGDTIFDFDLTPNRPDLLSMLGIAREVAALTEQAVREPSLQYPETGPAAKTLANVEIADPDLCPRYVAAVVQGVTVGESPAWLQERLTAAGMRPINNIVDITNYVMLETGQPLHAFDYERLRGHKIIVRRAAEGEKLELLDGSKRDLAPDMLVIADTEQAVAVAGVMGGANSEVTAATTTILLESANFNAPSIRRTSQALKTRTDASVRFEKGLSRELPLIAAQRAAKLMVEVAGGTAAKGLIDVNPHKAKDMRIELREERIQRVLGIDLPPAQVRQVLTALGFGARRVPPDQYIVKVPYWRTDVSIADDVIEELARIIGYDTLPTSQLGGAIPAYVPQPLRELREKVRETLADAGMQEIITYSMTDLETLQKVLPPEELATNPPLKLANPLSRELEYARTTLRHALLTTLAANGRGQGGLVALYETARVYLPRDGDLPHEVETACAVVAGRKPDRWGQPTGEPAGFFEAKGHLEYLLAELHIEADFREAVDFAYLPGRTAEVFAGGQRIGLIGQVHPRVAASFDIDSNVAMFELDIEAMLPQARETVHHQPVPPYPSVEQDLAVIVPADVLAGHVLAAIRRSDLVRAASVFDVYTGAPVPAGKKSIAFALSFQSPKGTLEDADVAKERTRIVERLRREFGAELRG